MCLIGLAIDAHPRFALVIAANRDEYFARPTAPLDWWQGSTPPVLAGRDLSAGGTWMGLSGTGRIALLTNVRDPSRHRAQAASRGALVADWLASNESAPDWWRARDAQAHNPFNLVAGDLVRNHWWWADDGASAPREIEPGVHGLSNAALDTPWPKVQTIRDALQSALRSADGTVALAATLFDALGDRRVAEDAALPDTGIGLARERMLSSAFIHWPEAAYGTRCTTVLAVERDGRGVLIERSFDAQGRPQQERRVDLVGWPFIDPWRSRVEQRAL